MILVKKWYFHLTFFVTCSLLILLGVIFYFSMSREDILNMLQIKFHAENAVFISIVFVLCVSILYIAMVRKSVKVLQELDKISQLSRQGRYYSEDFTRRLGKLGDRIDHLFLELNSLNEAKSLKIGVLSEVNRFLLEHCELRLCVVDIQGTIQQCSRRYADAFDLGMHDLRGKQITSMVRDLSFEELIRELSRRREGMSAGKRRFTVGEKSFEAVLELFPVSNANNELGLVICTAEREGILSDISQRAEQVQVQVSRVGKRFTDALKRKKKKQP
jgi:transcriptional regulator with PAS, ATPase and Fis domain